MNAVCDCRRDSSGFKAKYETYASVNAQTNLILDFHIIHVSVDDHSSQMEKEDLKHFMEIFVRKKSHFHP